VLEMLVFPAIAALAPADCAAHAGASSSVMLHDNMTEQATDRPGNHEICQWMGACQGMSPCGGQCANCTVSTVVTPFGEMTINRQPTLISISSLNYLPHPSAVLLRPPRI
jgi:hypothetical protein